jgi:hypothetical protein
MLTVALELALTCRACEARVAVNAVVSQIACGRCGVVVPLPIERWGQLLADVARDAPRMVLNDSATLPFEAPEGLFRRVIRREAARCLCQQEIDLSQAASTHAIGCSCGRWATVRKIPPLPVAAFLDEDAELLYGARQTAREAVAIRCTSCGGGLTPDGSSRMVTCPFCTKSSQLTDEVWARLHPLRPVRRFYLGLEAAADVKAEFPFDEAHQILLDHAGNLYVCGYVRDPEGNTERWGGVKLQNHLWSWDPQLQLRWKRKLSMSDPHIALTHDQRELILWSDEGAHRVYAAADGSSIKRQIPFPFEETQQLVADRDGTWIRISHTDVDRLNAAGEGLPLFPERKTGFFSGWGTEDDISIGFAATAVTPDGTIAVVQRAGGSVVLERWNRAGEKLPQVNLDGLVRSDDTSYAKLHCDQQGTLFLLLERRSCIVRIDATGPKKIATEITEDPCIALLRDGQIFVIGSDSVIQRFASDGRLLYENDAARISRNKRAVPEDEDLADLD